MVHRDTRNYRFRFKISSSSNDLLINGELMKQNFRLEVEILDSPNEF